MELTPQYIENRGTIYLRGDPKSRANKEGKPVIMFEGCEISRANSAWVQKSFQDGTKGEYRTEFILYRSDSKYYINVLGTSRNADDQTFSKVVEFFTPAQCMEILNSNEDTRLFMSEPIVVLLLDAAKSPLLDKTEKSIWIRLLAHSE